ncbi:hypothetical protein WS67_21495 [Burkholderia singularis]|uniref:Uncharacterized protein n=1 Tax=Burkholderia singularis TaxID=1503053 RepID=A0A103DW72_9BURK|nr:hypothetical protein [Burkholderia singularis]KVE23805.1 hypothetical protein WS67_21495 [Burkholderia singularis]
MDIRPAFSTACADVAATHGTSETVTLNFRHIIMATGKPLTATAVSEAPGMASRIHTRPIALARAHAASGTIESPVNDGPKPAHRAGERFFEEPG